MVGGKVAMNRMTRSGEITRRVSRKHRACLFLCYHGDSRNFLGGEGLFARGGKFEFNFPSGTMLVHGIIAFEIRGRFVGRLIRGFVFPPASYSRLK